MNGDRSLASALEDTADHAALGLGPVLVGAGHAVPLAAAAASMAVQSCACWRGRAVVPVFD